MITINPETLSIEVTESLDFNCQVEPRLTEIRNDLSYDVEDCFEEDDQESVRKFLAKEEFTAEDKCQILTEIKDYFERENNYYNNISIFDKAVIDEGIYRWIEEHYEVDIRPDSY